MSRPRVLVTDARRGSALAVIRSLGRRGLYVTAADVTSVSPGMHSRFASGRVRYSSPEQTPDAAAAALLQAARRLRIDLVIPVTEDVILPLTAAWQREEPRARLAVASAAALEVTWDKWQTLELARRLEVPVPLGRLVTSVDDAVRAARQFGWPVVVKPRRSRLYVPGRGLQRFEVHYAADDDQLVEMVSVGDLASGTIVQEFVSGEGHGVELLLHEGRPLAAFQHRRLREVPPTGGASAYRESVGLDPLLLEYSLRLLQELRWTGLVMVEFKLTPQGPRLMEINGRIWGSLPLAVASGMDFPYRLARLFLEGSTNNAHDHPETTYRIGVRSHDLALEASWIASTLARRRVTRGIAFPRRREALRAAASLLRPADRWDVADWRDPLPLAVEGVRLAMLAAAALRARSARSATRDPGGVA